MAWTSKQQSTTKDKDGILIQLREIVGGVNSKILAYSDIGVGHRFRILSLRLELIATATVGTRTPVIELEDAAGAILFSRIGATRTVAASATLTLQFGEGLEVSVADQERLPPLSMGPEMRLRIRDLANIDAVDALSVWVTGIARG